jgi:hypothetical protein
MTGSASMPRTRTLRTVVGASLTTRPVCGSCSRSQ